MLVFTIFHSFMGGFLVRQLLRRSGVGKTLLKVRQLKNLGAKNWMALRRYKRQFLPQIAKAVPLKADSGIDIHMLLHHDRIFDGCWALYSLAYFGELPCRIVIHDDGSLTSGDCSLLESLFLRCRIVRREEADKIVRGTFIKSGLKRCDEFREKLIFGLKLFDPFFFLEGESFILLDADVLIYRNPYELIEATVPVYSLDNGPRYSLPDVELRKLLGRDCIPRFNPGVLRAWKSTIELARIEAYLAHPGFWKMGKPDYYAELTLWAMELTMSGAKPLSNGYAICAASPEEREVVSGHYCGGDLDASLFYTRGLPYLAPTLLARETRRKTIRLRS